MSAHDIASKARRALRNQTGMTITLDQVRELAGYGLLELLAPFEKTELCPAKPLHSSSEITGSTSGETASLRTSGRSRPINRDRGPLSIAALSSGI